MEKARSLLEINTMTETDSAVATATLKPTTSPMDDLAGRLAQVEAQSGALEHELKAMRLLLERLIAHRQSSHNELVLLLTTLVSKLPINEVGGLVTRLVEHNTNVNLYLTALLKGTAEAHIEQPAVLKSLEQTKRDLAAAIPPLVDQLLKLDTPMERDLVEELGKNPESFYTPKVVRATRCFLKGQMPRERIVREFGETALPLFVDLTTDPKLNPRPKAEEIVLAFPEDFESALGRYPEQDKRAALADLHRRVQASRASSEQARQQKHAFQRLSFLIELLHYYEHQNTETPEVVFAHRLPALVEQLVLVGPDEELAPKLIDEAEKLMAHVVHPDHRQMIINNIGKSGSSARTLKYVLKLRTDKVPDVDTVVAEFVKHIVPPPAQKAPEAGNLAAILKLIHPTMQRMVIRAIMSSDRLRKEQAENLGKAIATQLSLTVADVAVPQQTISPEVERQIAWANIKDLFVRRSDPAVIAAAMRGRLSTKYDADEIRQSWITLTESDPMSLIRVFCQLPYGANGRTESIARPVMETYVSRLTHEKYAGTYNKVVTSLRNMYAAKPDSPTLTNFTALIRWVNPEAAAKLCADVGMAISA